MTRALRSYPASQRFEIARRRIAAKTGGLGYFAAVDFMGVHPDSAPIQSIQAPVPDDEPAPVEPIHKKKVLHD